MRTLDDIIPPSRRGGGQPSGTGAPSRPGPAARPQKRSRFPYTLGLVTVLVVGAGIAALIYFSRATVEVTPATAPLSVEGSYTAGPSGDFPFILVSVTKTAVATAPASGMKEENTRASGTIMVYNAGKKAVTLVAKTRFASPSGLIFRATKSVTIPAGSGSTPGSARAEVVADQPGPTYNVEAASFTVPGLAGTPDAANITARSEAPMTGGAAGQVPSVLPEASAAAAAAVQASLEGELTAMLAAQVPEGYLIIPGAATASYRTLAPAASAQAGQADIPVEGTMTGAAFPVSALLASVGGAHLAGGATLAAGATLALTPISAFPASDADSFSFSLSGAATLVSTVDPAQIAAAIAGKSRSEAEIALTNYPEVKRAVLVLRPFWKSRFPEDPSAIRVTVTAPENP